MVIWPKADVPNSINQTNQYVYKNVHVLSNSMSSVTEENKKNATTYFYPQPARDNIYFNDSDQIKSVKLFNILGKEVATYDILTANSVSISELPQGLYLIKLQTVRGEEKLQKLIIKR